MPVRRRGDEGKEERKRGDDEGKEGERTRRGLVMFRLFASVMLNSKENKKNKSNPFQRGYQCKVL